MVQRKFNDNLVKRVNHTYAALILTTFEGNVFKVTKCPSST